MTPLSIYLLLGSLVALATGLHATFAGDDYDSKHGPDPVMIYLITLALWMPLLVYLVWDTVRFMREKRVSYEKILDRRLG